MKAVIFIFLFLTLFNPISSNIAVLFNICLFLYIKDKVRVNYHKEYWYPTILLILSLLSMARFGTFDLTILGIYARMMISFIVIPYIVSYFAKEKKDIMGFLATCLFLHCCMVIVQLFLPELEWLNQSLFRYERDMESLEDLSSRRMGLSGSFDVAGFFAAACSIISYVQYVTTKKNIYLAFLLTSVFASIFTSRTGMSMGIIGIGFAYFFYGSTHSSLSKRYLSLFFVLAIGYFVVYPIVTGNFTAIDVMSNYGDNTFFYLSQKHLMPIYTISTSQLFWGVGALVSSVSYIYGWSDIGYVKQIFEVGLVGVFVMLFYCLRVCYKSIKSAKIPKDGTVMIALLTLLILVFNYKNEFLWQVGTFDLYLIIYYYQKSKSQYTKNGLL